MRALWEAVAKRGEKKKANGSEYKVGLERAKYIEFEYGTHSECLLIIPCCSWPFGANLVLYFCDLPAKDSNESSLRLNR